MEMPQDILEVIRRDYGVSASFVADLLSSEMRDAREGARVVRCIVSEANGDMNRLGALVDAAHKDYRDVIFWAEYVDHRSKDPQRIFDFSRPFGQHVLKTQRTDAD